MPKIDIDAVEPLTGSDYPAPYNLDVAGRHVRRLSPTAGLTDLEVNHVVLPPGAWSSQRHWHEGEDEVVVVIAGSATLRDEDGETPIAAGDCIAFPMNDGNGHHLVAGPEGCTLVAMGRPEHSPVHYPDVDMRWDFATDAYMHKDGTPY